MIWRFVKTCVCVCSVLMCINSTVKTKQLYYSNSGAVSINTYVILYYDLWALSFNLELEQHVHTTEVEECLALS